MSITWGIEGGTGGGLGSEGKNAAEEIAAFEAAHPNVSVKVMSLAATTDQALAQVQQRLVANSGTPDVIDADVTWTATFAKAGWISPLDDLGADTGRFFPGQIAAVTYKGKTYALPWYINVQGLYYRTDLVKTAPTSPADVVTAAKAALAADPKLKEGVAFTGSKYEGAVCTYLDILGGFGGTLDPQNLNTPEAVQALQYMHDLVYKDKVSPAAVTGWTEDNTGSAFESGQAAFAIQWPYVLRDAQASGSAIAGKVAWVPFPSVKQSEAALGGDVLMLNAKSDQKEAAMALMQFLMQPDQQIKRAVDAGDPPSVRSAYTDALYSKAPYYKTEQAVFDAATPRPVTPDYPKISQALQLMISQVLSNQATPAKALATAASSVQGLETQ